MCDERGNVKIYIMLYVYVIQDSDFSCWNKKAKLREVRERTAHPPTMKLPRTGCLLYVSSNPISSCWFLHIQWRWKSLFFFSIVKVLVVCFSLVKIHNSEWRMQTTSHIMALQHSNSLSVVVLKLQGIFSRFSAAAYLLCSPHHHHVTGGEGYKCIRTLALLILFVECLTFFCSCWFAGNFVLLSHLHWTAADYSVDSTKARKHLYSITHWPSSHS